MSSLDMNSQQLQSPAQQLQLPGPLFWQMSLPSLEPIMEEGFRMAFSPNHSPLQGGAALAVVFADDTRLPVDVEFFVVFEGSTQRHVTSAVCLDRNKLSACIPEHPLAETVLLRILLFQHGGYRILATGSFHYIQDPVRPLAEFLVDSVCDLNSLANMDRIQAQYPAAFEQDFLDERLCQELTRVKIPPGWRLSGDRSIDSARETLLHFAARLGFEILSTWLLQTRGSREALGIPNTQGMVPAVLARQCGHVRTAQVLEERLVVPLPRSPWRLLDHRRASQQSLVRYHEAQQVTSITSAAHGPPAPGKMAATFAHSIDEDIERLQQVSLRPRGSSSPRAPISRPDSGLPDCFASDESYGEDDAFEAEDDGVPSHHHGNRTRRHRRMQPHLRSQPGRRYSADAKVRAGFSDDDLSDIDTPPPPLPLSAPPIGPNVPSICVSPPASNCEQGTEVLEDSLRRLQEIHEGIHRLREISAHQKNPNFSPSPTPDANETHVEGLRRFSTSCPSLAEPEFVKIGIPVKPEPTSDISCHKSMLNLAEDDRSNNNPSPTAGSDTLTVPDMVKGGGHCAGERRHSHIGGCAVDVRIVISEVPTDESEDAASAPPQPPSAATLSLSSDPELLIEHIKKQQKRRSSWCPEKERKKEEKGEKQRMLLAVSGRSQSLSSLDGQDDDSDEEDDSDDVDSASRYHDGPPRTKDDLYDVITEPPGGAKGNYDDGKKVVSVGPNRGGMPPLNCSAAATRGPATTSPDDAGSASPDSPGMLSVSPPGGGPPNLMKSVSSPSIGPPPKEAYNNRSRTSKETSNPTAARPPHQPQHHVSIQQLIDDHDAQLANRAASQDAANHGGVSMPTDEDVMLNNYLHSNNNHGHLPHGRRSMVELLSETPDDDDEQRPRKDEKKRRSSVFSKLGSYRQKKLVKDPKLKSTHTFVSVSFSNSTACDVCSRSMANKPALQCENCMVNVHDSCRDQIAPCARLSQNSKAATISNDETREKKANSLPEGGSGVSLKGSQSFKEKRATSVPGRVSLQVSHSSGALLPRSSSPIKVISEERDKDKNVAPKEDEGMAHIQLPDITNSMVEAMSASMESLEENSDVPEIEEDVNAEIGACHEAEAWSVTVDKKTLKKLSAKDIKRQDHIWELIQTERRHYRTLSIMQKKFAVGLRREVNLSQDMISRIFPRLEELLEIHRSFVQQLMDRQREKPDKSIDSIGDVLLNQFDGEMGQRMKEAYGEFCSRHNEAVQLYKDLLKQDRKFQAFIKKCKRGDLTKRLGVQECILLVTQRMTKYPLLIEPIIKVTKDNKVERESLEHALILTREVLTFINAQVDAHEKKQRLIDIYHKMEVRSFGMLKGSKFRKSDLLSSNRKLLYEGSIKWMSARGKSAEVLAVILSDVMFFLAESNQKYSFFTHDNKASVISLSKLLVREKGDTRDSKGIYLICQSKKNPEMYELVCRSADGRKAWIRMLKEAVANCPEETEGITSENEEEKKLLEARSVRIRQLINQMHHRDQEIQGLCDHKMKLITDLLEVFAKEEITVSRTIYKDDEGQEMMDAEDIQQAILNEATQLSTLFRPFVSRQVSRSGSSASETDQTKASNSSKPKRAETFSGFDRDKATRVRQRHPSSLQDTESRSNSMINLVDDSSNESLLTVESSINAAQNRQVMRRGSMVVTGSDAKVNKEKVSRRMSTSLLPGLLHKRHLEKDEETKEGAGSGDDSGTPALCEAAEGPFAFPTHEHCASIAQLLQYVHSLVTISSKQTTESESFRAQLAEANSKASLLFTENERLMHDRKHGYHHDKQLEELRNLQEAVQQERKGFEKEREKQQLRLEADREEIRSLQENVEKQKAELRAQKDELQRQKETLQRQVDMFEAQKAQLAEQRNNLLMKKDSRDRSQSPKYSLSTARSASKSSLKDNVQHKRSSSDDLQTTHRQGSPFEPMKAEYSHSLKEPLRLAAEAAARNSRSQLGAINESLTVQQQLPLKLAGSRGGKQSPTHVFRPTPTTGVQFIPAYDQQQQQQCVDSRLAGPSHVFRPTPSHTISTPSSAPQHLPYRLAEGGAARAAQQLPLKLASDSTKPRPRSANSSQSGGHSKPHMSSPPDSAKHSLFAKDRQEPEIIYF